MVQSSNLVHLESDVEAIRGVVLHLYVCPFVCKSMKRKLYLYETSMYFSYFVYIMSFGLYNLVVCYSLDPVLVIWYVTLIIFCKFKYISLN